MTDADDMIHVAQYKLQQLICQYTGSIRKSKQRVIREYRPQAHSSRM